MMCYFIDESGNDIATAEFSALPHAGDQIGLRLYPGGFTKDGGIPPFDSSLLLKAERVTFEAFNSAVIDEQLLTWTRGKDAYAIITVSPQDEQTQAYMQRLKEQEKEASDEH